MLSHDLKAFLMLFNFQTQLMDKSDLLSDNLVEFLVLLVGIVGKVLIQVVLCNGVNDVIIWITSVLV